jgi:hypothetical protein
MRVIENNIIRNHKEGVMDGLRLREGGTYRQTGGKVGEGE